MIELSDKLKSSLSGKTTKLNCFVYITTQYSTDLWDGDSNPNSYPRLVKTSYNFAMKEQSLNISRYNMTLHHKPLLNKFPNIKSKVDLISNKHSISNCIIDINDMEYKGQKFSENVKDLIGQIVYITYGDIDALFYDDCALLYTGILKRYEQTPSSVILSVEDISSVKYDVQIPTQNLPYSDSVRESDRGKPYPMVYGYCPTVPLRQSQKLESSTMIFDSFMYDRPDIPTLGTYIIDDMYSQNQYLQDVNHHLNGDYYSLTPYGNYFTNGFDEDGNYEEYYTPLQKDYLYVYDQTLMPIMIQMLSGFTVSPESGLDFSYNMGASRKCYELGEIPNTISITDDFFYFLGEAQGANDTVSEGEGINFDTNRVALFSRIYRPIKRITFYQEANRSDYGNPTYDDIGKIDGKTEFFGISPSRNNGGLAWNRGTNYWLHELGVLTGDDILDEGFSNDIESATLSQYQNNWNGGTKDWWAPTNIYQTALEENGESTIIQSKTDLFWNNTGKKGEQNEFVGEFPVHYLQNGDDEYGLFIASVQHNDNKSTASAKFYFDERNGTKFKGVTKIFGKYEYNVDVGASKAMSEIDTAFSFRSFIGFGGWSKSLKPVSQSSQFFNNDVSDYNSGDQWRALWIYGNYTNAFNGFLDGEKGYPYGPEWYVTNTSVSDPENESDILKYDFTRTIGTLDNGYQTVSNIETLEDLNTINYVIPAQYGEGDLVTFSNQMLTEIYFFQDFTITDLGAEDFYASIAGRLFLIEDENEFENDQIQPVRKPSEIIKHIWQMELNNHITWFDTDIDEEVNNWNLSMCIHEHTTFKKLIEEMFSQTLTTTRFKSNGKIDFITHKSFISRFQPNFISSKIDVDDVSNYKFKFTDSEKIANRVNVIYDYDIPSKNYKKETGYDIVLSDGASYNNLDSLMDSLYPDETYSVEFYKFMESESSFDIKAKYITDENQAKLLQRKLLMWYANQHLIVNITLNNKYIGLEVGDYIEFDDLIDNKKAFGYDYTKDIIKNGQIVYKQFIITSIQKTGTKIVVEALQLHRLQIGYGNLDNFGTNDWYDDGSVLVSGIDVSDLFYINPDQIINPDDIITDNEETDYNYSSNFDTAWITEYDNDTTQTKYMRNETIKLQISSNMITEEDDLFYYIQLVRSNYDINFGGIEIPADTTVNINVTDYFTIRERLISDNLRRLELTPLYTFEDIPTDFKLEFKVYTSPENFSYENIEIPTFEDIETAIEES